MIEDKTPMHAKTPSASASPETEDEAGQQSQETMAMQANERMAPGRRPLFKNERPIRRGHFH